MAVDSDLQKVNGANTADGMVSVIDGATNTVETTISVGSVPVQLVIGTGVTQIGVIASTMAQSVSVIDGASCTLIISILPVTGHHRAGRRPRHRRDPGRLPRPGFGGPFEAYDVASQSLLRMMAVGSVPSRA